MVARVFVASLLATSVLFVGLAPTQVRAHDGSHSSGAPVVDINSLIVESVDVVDGELVATAVYRLKVAGRGHREVVEIPLNVGGTEVMDGCAILNLSLGPVRLNLLGLMVHLYNCEGGPVTVDVTAFAGDGLLGDLLCSVAGKLAAGDTLEEVLAGLDDVQLATLTGALSYILTETIEESLLECDVDVHDSITSSAVKRKRCNILTLEVPQGITLNILGLQVDTSPICLDIFARRDRGPLGNALCLLIEAFDTKNRPPGRVQVLKNRIWNALEDLRFQL